MGTAEAVALEGILTQDALLTTAQAINVVDESLRRDSSTTDVNGNYSFTNVANGILDFTPVLIDTK